MISKTMRPSVSPTRPAVSSDAQSPEAPLACERGPACGHEPVRVASYDRSRIIEPETLVRYAASHAEHPAGVSTLRILIHTKARDMSSGVLVAKAERLMPELLARDVVGAIEAFKSVGRGRSLGLEAAEVLLDEDVDMGKEHIARTLDHILRLAASRDSCPVKLANTFAQKLAAAGKGGEEAALQGLLAQHRHSRARSATDSVLLPHVLGGIIATEVEIDRLVSAMSDAGSADALSVDETIGVLKYVIELCREAAAGEPVRVAVVTEILESVFAHGKDDGGEVTFATTHALAMGILRQEKATPPKR